MGAAAIFSEGVQLMTLFTNSFLFGILLAAQMPAPRKIGHVLRVEKKTYTCTYVVFFLISRVLDYGTLTSRVTYVYCHHMDSRIMQTVAHENCRQGAKHAMNQTFRNLRSDT